MSSWCSSGREFLASDSTVITKPSISSGRRILFTHPIDPRGKGFCHAMASRPARGGSVSIKTGTIERPTAASCTHRLAALRSVLEYARTNLSLSFFLSLALCDSRSAQFASAKCFPPRFLIFRHGWTSRLTSSTRAGPPELASRRTRPEGKRTGLFPTTVYRETCVREGLRKGCLIETGGGEYLFKKDERRL